MGVFGLTCAKIQVFRAYFVCPIFLLLAVSNFRTVMHSEQMLKIQTESMQPAVSSKCDEKKPSIHLHRFVTDPWCQGELVNRLQLLEAGLVMGFDTFGSKYFDRVKIDICVFNMAVYQD
jgi:hypothetical protein